MGRTSSWLVRRAWLGGTTLEHDVLIRVVDDIIEAVEPGSSTAGVMRLPGIALPGLVNTHSHAFHRVLRGRTQAEGGDFWAWRDLMYEVASTLTPETYEDIATSVFVEMALAGITAVGEFHYLHHQPGGTPYTEPNEMGHALVRAARRAGIRIALLDAGYLAAGFGDETAHPVQERFSDAGPDEWLARVESLRQTYHGAADVVVGLAPHSVRAMPETGLRRLMELRPRHAPLHIHLSEQPAENEACLAATGTTPTGLLDRLGLLGPQTTAVHATHLTVADIATLGDTGAGVCYCATTERDLGDGLGPSAELHRAGVPLSVGSDSHALIDLFEEARGLELHARLASGKRGALAPSTLAEAATANGASALGFDGGRLEAGCPADFIVVSDETPAMVGSADDVAGVMFAAGAADVTDVFVGGTRIVTGGHHPEWESAREALRRAGLRYAAGGRRLG